MTGPAFSRLEEQQPLKRLHTYLLPNPKSKLIRPTLHYGCIIDVDRVYSWAEENNCVQRDDDIEISREFTVQQSVARAYEHLNIKCRGGLAATVAYTLDSNQEELTVLLLTTNFLGVDKLPHREDRKCLAKFYSGHEGSRWGWNPEREYMRFKPFDRQWERREKERQAAAAAAKSKNDSEPGYGSVPRIESRLASLELESDSKDWSMEI
ncbi:hypothetical protein BJ138DRAFT_580775 [Hygrophoropsis aurantiaca]|uniref:Uncharacterized protein n=1 Tax=Hygrophoropsis aurantiaca TaxID=72124 RepID=A0ACB8A0U6_9AGAM|nr:hypothetical protein BJ138DRAFT_580775 [Hygrophoropsis aurantiaca]